MKKTVAVLQSNYLPWKGYFDIVNDVDLFIFYDDVKYTKNDWRNRNKIKTPKGTEWITIPISASSGDKICDVELTSHAWQEKHVRTVANYYRRSPFFSDFEPFFGDIFRFRSWRMLSELNQYLVKTISQRFLGIETRFMESLEIPVQGRRQERLLEILRHVGATDYVSGPAAKAYIDESAFEREGIRVHWKSYEGYPEYPQLYPPFEHAVSVIDLLLNTGPEAPYYIWGWRGEWKDG